MTEISRNMTEELSGRWYDPSFQLISCAWLLNWNDKAVKDAKFLGKKISHLDVFLGVRA